MRNRSVRQQFAHFCARLSILGCCMIPAFLYLSAAPHPCAYRYHQSSTEVDSHKVITEYYIPTSGTRFPLVFMLHGSAGAFSTHTEAEPAQDNFGEKTLAENCFAVVLPHYFDAFGLKSLTSQRELIALFPRLLDVADKMLMDAESVTSTEKGPVFLFGESLGGYLSVALALRHQEVVALSEIGAGIPAGHSLQRPMPLAMLISHGAVDQVVPEVEAEKLKEFCIQHGIEFTLRIYPSANHYLSEEDEADWIIRTVDFFRTEQHAN